jgi:hypothetical protein
MVSATQAPNIKTALRGQWDLRSILCLGPIDHTICYYLASCSIANTWRRSGRLGCLRPHLHAANPGMAGPDFTLYVSPETMSFQAMRAILLASATAANLGGFRVSSSASHREALPDRRA